MGSDASKVGSKRSIKVAAIDLNNTLIKSKSGTLHGKDETDWQWWHQSVPCKLRAISQEGYTVIISSNQGRLTELDGSEAPEAAPFKRKMAIILRELQIPVTLMVACANDMYRKPRPGMWPIMAQLTGNAGCNVDMAQSLVVGDAAGRESDFSDSDIHWAMNVGVRFDTPEVVFLGQAPGPTGHIFHPEWYLKDRSELIAGGLGPRIPTESVLVLVGLPGSGKTIFFQRVLQDCGFTRVDARSYDSHQSFVLAVDRSMAEGIPVVIDDLNLDADYRRTWIALAEKNGIASAAVFFTAPVNLCLHNDTVRALGGPPINSENRPVCPRLHFLDQAPRLKRPTTSEGFTIIHEIDFRWIGTEEELAIWKKFWV